MAKRSKTWDFARPLLPKPPTKAEGKRLPVIARTLSKSRAAAERALADQMTSGRSRPGTTLTMRAGAGGVRVTGSRFEME